VQVAGELQRVQPHAVHQHPHGGQQDVQGVAEEQHQRGRDAAHRPGQAEVGGQRVERARHGVGGRADGEQAHVRNDVDEVVDQRQRQHRVVEPVAPQVPPRRGEQHDQGQAHPEHRPGRRRDGVAQHQVAGEQVHRPRDRDPADLGQRAHAVRPPQRVPGVRERQVHGADREGQADHVALHRQPVQARPRERGRQRVDAEDVAGEQPPRDRDDGQQAHQREDAPGRVVHPAPRELGEREEDRAVPRVADDHGEEQAEEDEERQADVDVAVGGHHAEEAEQGLDRPQPARIADQGRRLGRVLHVADPEAPALLGRQAAHPLDGVFRHETAQQDDGADGRHAGPHLLDPQGVAARAQPALEDLAILRQRRQAGARSRQRRVHAADALLQPLGGLLGPGHLVRHVGRVDGLDRADQRQRAPAARGAQVDPGGLRDLRQRRPRRRVRQPHRDALGPKGVQVARVEGAERRQPLAFVRQLGLGRAEVVELGGEPFDLLDQLHRATVARPPPCAARVGDRGVRGRGTWDLGVGDSGVVLVSGRGQVLQDADRVPGVLDSLAQLVRLSVVGQRVLGHV
jgi:hypothetical protein